MGHLNPMFDDDVDEYPQAAEALIQLLGVGDMPDRDLAERIVTEHLERYRDDLEARGIDVRVAAAAGDVSAQVLHDAITRGVRDLLAHSLADLGAEYDLVKRTISIPSRRRRPS